MSRIIATAAITGAHKYVEQAEADLKAVMESKGGATPLVFPNTAFYLPLILATTGIEVKTVEEHPTVGTHGGELACVDHVLDSLLGPA